MSKLGQTAAGIALAAFDIDGVFTDGGFLLDADGRELKRFHTRDGYGIRRLLDAGVAVAVISGRSAPAVEHRMRELGVEHVHQGVGDKVVVVEALQRELGVAHAATAYLGDDLPDLPVMRLVGLPAAVADAAPAVRSAARYVTGAPGGHGAVREFCDLLLDARPAK